eukprot:EG_transcript_8924
MSMKTTGYVSIGFSDWAGMMGPADAYAGWVDGNGQIQAVDFSTTYHNISLDAQQDVQAVSGSQDSNGVLKVTFSRRLDTKDPQDKPITNTSMNLIWCWADALPAGNSLPMHSGTGSTQVNFFTVAPNNRGQPTGKSSKSSTSTTTGSSPAPSSSPPNSTTANSSAASFCSDPFCLAWSLSSDSIAFKMTMQTSGYVSIGFSDSSGSMGPADAYAGWVDSSGTVHVIDFTTTHRDVNPPDAVQNVFAVSGSSAVGTLTVMFSRPLSTGDSQDKSITNAPMNLIWCWADSLPSGNSLPTHGGSQTGSAQVNFFTGAVQVNSDTRLWVPAAAVVLFMLSLLLPGVIARLCGCSAAANGFFCFRPFVPRPPRWWDGLLLGLVPAVRDLQLGDIGIAGLWLVAGLAMLLFAEGDAVGRVCAVAFGTLFLPITKHSIWALVLGASFDRYLKFHRWAARTTFIALVIHLIDQVSETGSDVLSFD